MQFWFLGECTFNIGEMQFWFLGECTFNIGEMQSLFSRKYTFNIGEMQFWFSGECTFNIGEMQFWFSGECTFNVGEMQFWFSRKCTFNEYWRFHCGVVAKVMDDGPEVSEFEIQSRYYVHFRSNAPWKRYKPPYSLCSGNYIYSIIRSS